MTPFLGWDFSTPLIVVILGALVAGVILDELFGLVTECAGGRR